MDFYYGTFKSSSKYKNAYVPIVAKHRYDAIKYMKEHFIRDYQHLHNIESSNDFKTLKDKYKDGPMHPSKNHLILSTKPDQFDKDRKYFDIWILCQYSATRPIQRANLFMNLHAHLRVVLKGGRYVVYGNNKEVVMFTTTGSVMDKYFKALYPTYMKGARGRYVKVADTYHQLKNIYIDSTSEFFRINATVKGRSGKLSPVISLFEYNTDTLSATIDLIEPHTYKKPYTDEE